MIRIIVFTPIIVFFFAIVYTLLLCFNELLSFTTLTLMSPGKQLIWCHLSITPSMFVTFWNPYSSPSQQRCIEYEKVFWHIIIHWLWVLCNICYRVPYVSLCLFVVHTPRKNPVLSYYVSGGHDRGRISVNTLQSFDIRAFFFVSVISINRSTIWEESKDREISVTLRRY